jgi:lauroyl/myristoyl acyltransferase
MKLILRFFCYLDYRVFLRLMAVLPRWLALPFVWLRGGLNFLFDADWRTLSLGQQYVRTATQKTMQAWHQKQTHPTTYWQQPTWLTLRRYLHTSIEEYDATHLKQVCDTSPFHIDGLEWLKQAQAQKIGVVLVHAHFDSLYPGLIFLAQQGLRVNLVSTRLMFDQRVCAGASQHFAHKMAQLNQALAPGGVFHVEENLLFFTRALKNGEIVVIAGDGPASSPSRATEVSFWGDQQWISHPNQPTTFIARAGHRTRLCRFRNEVV